jgi:hypothetical protein
VTVSVPNFNGTRVYTGKKYNAASTTRISVFFGIKPSLSAYAAGESITKTTATSYPGHPDTSRYPGEPQHIHTIKGIFFGVRPLAAAFLV